MRSLDLLKKTMLFVFLIIVSTFALCLFACKSDTKKYQITFVQEGYDNVVVGVDVGSVIKEEDIPTPRIEPGYTVAWDKNPLEITDTATVTAVKTANTYVINLTLLPESKIGQVATIATSLGWTLTDETNNVWSKQVKFNEDFTIPNPQYVGDNNFRGWSKNGVDYTNVSGKYGVVGNLDLVAKWDTSIPYKLTVKLAPEVNTGVISTMDTSKGWTCIDTAKNIWSKDVYYGEEFTIETPSVYGGDNTFKGWKQDGKDYVKPQVYDKIGNTELVAQWEWIGI